MVVQAVRKSSELTPAYYSVTSRERERERESLSLAVCHTFISMVSKTGRRQAVRALAHIHKYFHQTIYRFLYNTLRRIEIQSIRSRVGTVSIIALSVLVGFDS
jgi:hypothetical protein